MSTQNDLLTDHPSPNVMPVSLKCKNCLHFKNVPAFRVGGRSVVCSSTVIGRNEKDVPCVRFSHDSVAFLNLPVRIRKMMRMLIRAIGEETQFKNQRNDITLVLINYLITTLTLRKKGYEFGQSVKFSEGRKGKLMAITGNRAIVESEDVKYNVSLEELH